MKALMLISVIAGLALPGQAQVMVGYPGYYYYDSGPNYTFGGAVLGGLTGALMGGHHHAAEGAAIGLGAGLLLGSIADYGVRQQQYRYWAEAAAPYSMSPAYTVSSAPPPAQAEVQAPAPAPAPPPPPPSPMSSANQLFGR